MKILFTLILCCAINLCFSQVTITSKIQKTYLIIETNNDDGFLEQKEQNTFIEFTNNFKMISITNDNFKLSGKIIKQEEYSKTIDLYQITSLEGDNYALVVDQDENCVILSFETKKGVYMYRFDVYKIF